MTRPRTAAAGTRRLHVDTAWLAARHTAVDLSRRARATATLPTKALKKKLARPAVYLPMNTKGLLVY